MKLSELKKKFWPRESDEAVIRRSYRASTGHTLDLENPKGFHEKLCWIRLNGLTPLHAYCTDKLTAPAYIASRIGPGHTVRTYFRTTNPDYLGPDAIPATRCVVKPNHFSGQVFVVDDTTAADWAAIREAQRLAINTNFYSRHRESQYRRIRPAILVEEHIDQTGVELAEIKMFCLNGIARFAMIFRPGAVLARTGGMHVDRDGNPIAVGRIVNPVSEFDVKIPTDYSRLRDLAETLAAPFPLVRVDFLLGAQKTYISELTFSPVAGYERFIPESFEQEMGALLNHRARSPWRRFLAEARRHEAAEMPPLLQTSPKREKALQPNVAAPFPE